MKLTHRYITRIVLEAQTGLFVGSGDASLMKDALVQKDHNGWPMIQGTSLSGVIRHALEDNPNSRNDTTWKNIFGHQTSGLKEGIGSRIKISSAYMMINENCIAEGLHVEDSTVAKRKYNNLPSRQHVRITDKGVALKNGLFDNEIVFKGTRFIFEIELKGTEADKSSWNDIIQQLHSPLFRLGQGTRNGYGNLKVHTLRERIYDLTSETDFEDYLNFDPSFNVENKGFLTPKYDLSNSNLVTYTLDLKPDQFFIFSEGFGDDQVDNKPITEEVAVYKKKENTIDFTLKTLIPASSIKGALSHRTCFHYNKLEKKFADHGEGAFGEQNEAVQQLFGSMAGNGEAHRGTVIMDDLYLDEVDNDKIFNHVAIDRFTGGAMDGALFSEKVSYKKDGNLVFSIYLTKEFSGNVLLAFEDALRDICKGLLPLGGMTTKGHGIFTGRLFKNNKNEFDYENEAN